MKRNHNPTVTQLAADGIRTTDVRNYRVELSDTSRSEEHSEWIAVVSFHEKPKFTEELRDDEERSTATACQARRLL